MYTYPNNRVLKMVLPIFLAVIFVALTLLTIFGAVRWFNHVESLDGYVVAASNHRLSTKALVTNATDAAGGNEESFSLLSETRIELNQLTELLKNGSVEQSIATPPEALESRLENIGSLVNELDTYVETIDSSRNSILTLSDLSNQIGLALPNLNRIFTQITERIESLGLDSVETYYLTRQLYLTERIKLSQSNMLSGGSAMALAVDSLTQDIDELKLILDAMVIGNFSLGINPIQDSDAKTQLVEASSIVVELTQVVTEILNLVGDVLPALQSIEREGGQLRNVSPMVTISANIDNTVRGLIERYREATDQSTIGGFAIGPRELIILASAALITLLLFFWVVSRRQKKRVDMMATEHDENEAAVHNLVIGMNSLSGTNIDEQGVRSDGITSSVSEAINTGVMRLKQMADASVSKSESVSRVAEGVRSNLLQLKDNIVIQSRRSQNASKSVASLSSLFSDLTRFVSESRTQSQSISSTVLEGNDVVRRTVQGIESARERITDTAKRLQRMDENSQEVGKLIETIEDIADENNFIVLNAAMQSASGGEASQGLAILADDVQRLAERSANTTRRIDVLIQTIQADTAEAVNAMDTTRSEVQKSADIAAEIRQTLKNIEDSIKKDAGRADQLAQSVSRNVNESEELSTILTQIYEGSEASISETAGAEGAIESLMHQIGELKDIQIGSRVGGLSNEELMSNSDPSVPAGLTHIDNASS